MQVCISYERKPLNPAWTIQNEPWHVLRLMTQLWTTAYVDILPMHEPSDAEKQDAQLYAENVRSMMVCACCPGLNCAVPLFLCSRESNDYCKILLPAEARTCDSFQKERWAAFHLHNRSSSLLHAAHILEYVVATCAVAFESVALMPLSHVAT